MKNRLHSEEIRKRFVQAVEAIASSGYPKDSTVVSIVRSIGLEPSNFYRLRKEGQYPTLDNCVELCLKYDINPLWLFMGDGSMKEIKSNNVKPLDQLKVAVLAIEAELNN